MNQFQLPWPENAVRIRLPALTGLRPVGATASRRARRLKSASGLQQRFAMEFPDGSILVDTPLISQPTAWSCAIVGMAFGRAYDLGPDNIEDWLKGMGTLRSGTDPSPINKFLRKIGFKSRIETGMTDSDLMDLYDREIGAMLAIQAWASNPADYKDPKNYDNGHWVGGVGYFSGPAQIPSRYNPDRYKANRLLLLSRLLSTARATDNRINYFLHVDPSIVCRYGYLGWPDLDPRWRDSAGPRSRPKPNRHLGIIMDPNGRKPVHNFVADPIL